MGFYAACLVLWGLAGWRAGLGWPFAVGLGVAALLAAHHYLLIRERTREGCFKAFTRNHWLGLAVWIGVMAGLGLRAG